MDVNIDCEEIIENYKNIDKSNMTSDQQINLLYLANIVDMKCLMNYRLIILIEINGIMLNLILVVLKEHNRNLILVLVILLLYMKK